MSDREQAVRAVYQELRIADQLGFYNARKAEYDRASSQAILVRNAVLGLAALAGVAGQFVDGNGRVAAGVAAAVLAAVATAVTAFEALIGFGPMAKLYGDAAINLRQAELDFDRGASLSADVDRIEEVFRTENGQWGQLLTQPPPPGPASAPGGES